MTTMIERVAAAMREELGVGWPYTGHAELVDTARAAIEAMREPTEDMVSAASVVTIDCGDFVSAFGERRLSPEDAKDAWQAMIDAALNETQAPPASLNEKEST